MADKALTIDSPLVICFESEEIVITRLHPSEKCGSFETYGILIADIVRHVANCFHVSEDDVWEWVNRERYHPTSTVKEVN